MVVAAIGTLLTVACSPLLAYAAQVPAPTQPLALTNTLIPRAHTELTSTQRLDYAYGYYANNDYERAEQTPEKIWQGIEGNGWPDALGDFQTRFYRGKSYLVLYKKFPQHPIDMRSPQRFKNSTIVNELLEKNSIGHMSIGWSCDSAGDTQPRIEGFAAQTGEYNGQQRDMVDQGWGLTSTLSTFTDGYLQNGFDIQRYFSTDYVARTEKGLTPNPYFALVVEVPHQECERVRSFVKTYVFHPGKPYRNFSMYLDPEKFEGAGCGSFAATALAQAASLAPLMHTYWRTLPVPAKVLGLRRRMHLPNNAVPPWFAKTDSEEHLIGKKDLFFMNWDTGRTALQIRLVDPELAIFSFRALAEHATTPATRSQSKALAKLRRFYNFANQNTEAGIDDKDTGFQEIDPLFDPSFYTVFNTVAQWWHQREANSNLDLVTFPYGVGVFVHSR